MANQMILQLDYTRLSRWVQCNYKGPYMWMMEAQELMSKKVSRKTGFEDKSGMK